MNARNFREREGWRSLRSALASIWRMRSRVTANDFFQSVLAAIFEAEAHLD